VGITALAFEMCSWGLEFVLPEKWMHSSLMRVMSAGPMQSPKHPRALVSFSKVHMNLRSLSV